MEIHQCMHQWICFHYGWPRKKHSLLDILEPIHLEVNIKIQSPLVLKLPQTDFGK